MQIDVPGKPRRSRGIPGSIFGLKPRKTGPIIFSQTAFRYPAFRCPETPLWQPPKTRARRSPRRASAPAAPEGPRGVRPGEAEDKGGLEPERGKRGKGNGAKRRKNRGGGGEEEGGGRSREHQKEGFSRGGFSDLMENLSFWGSGRPRAAQKPLKR